MKSITDRYWNEPDKFTPSKEQIVIAQKLRVKPEIINMAEKRGIKGETALRKYLYPSLNDLENPFSMKDMEKACSVIYEAITTNQEILIWGDYDVDGVTSTCLLVRFFNSVGVFPRWYIPNRFTEGYGLNSYTLKSMIKNGNDHPPILITVDCGITNHSEIKEAQAKGCKVVITDHHEPGEKAIEADAILNVKQKGCSFKDKNVAGVGTAFYLAVGLRSFLAKKSFFSEKNLTPPNLKKLLELVAIGTIADMVPLKASNRILVRAGFEVMNTIPSPGVAAIMRVSDINTGGITSDDIAFQVGPIINAAGRLKSASLAVKLLLEEERAVAVNHAKKLLRLNNERKKMCGDSLERTLGIARNDMYCGASCVIMKVEDNIGILGIVASQITEKLKVPVILVTRCDDKKHGPVLKGSCRSVKGVNIFETLERSQHNLIAFGGHKMAAGITLQEESFENFKNDFFNNLLEDIESNRLKGEFIDNEVDLERALEQDFLKNLQLMEPFGIENPKPFFMSRTSRLTEIKRIGKKGDHLVFKKRGKYTNHNCVAFNFGNYENNLKNKPDFDIVYSVMISRFKQSVRWQANVIDII